MERIDREGIVQDAAGETWECRWQQLVGYPLPTTTPVQLRRPGTDEYTHFVTAQYSADYFEPSFIDGKCAPLERSQ